MAHEIPEASRARTPAEEVIRREYDQDFLFAEMEAESVETIERLIAKRLEEHRARLPQLPRGKFCQND